MIYETAGGERSHLSLLRKSEPLHQRTSLVGEVLGACSELARMSLACECDSVLSWKLHPSRARKINDAVVFHAVAKFRTASSVQFESSRQTFLSRVLSPPGFCRVTFLSARNPMSRKTDHNFITEKKENI